VDRTVIPGQRYGYRLCVAESGTERYYGEAWVEVAGEWALTLEGLQLNPAEAELADAFTLAAPSAAQLMLLDFAGRQVRAWRLEGLEAGRHLRRLGSAAGLAPGMYFLRLTQGEAAVTRRVTVLR
jgi:hypothetical protein